MYIVLNIYREFMLDVRVYAAILHSECIITRTHAQTMLQLNCHIHVS